MSWETTYREELIHVFVHESGHTLMAMLLAIPCRGIFFERGYSGGRFCSIYALPSGAPSHNDYLVAAAGFAAETLFFPDPDVDGSRHDKIMFDKPGAPPFDTTVLEARQLLEARRTELDRVKSKLEEKLGAKNFDLSQFPEIGMDGSDKRFRILLTQEELALLISTQGADGAEPSN